VNSGDTPAVPLAIPAERAIELPLMGRGPAEPMSALAMTLAALLHVAVPVMLLLHWPARAPIVVPQPIPVALVMVRPPEAPLTPPPPEAPKEQLESHYLESGPGEHTTALAPAEAVAPERASPPPEPDAPTNTPVTEPAETAAGEAPAEKPAPAPVESQRVKPKPRKLAHLEPAPKEASKPQAERPAPPPRHVNIQLGDKNESGDPWLNRVMEVIEAHRVYPRITGQFGLLVEGVAVYAVLIDRSGVIKQVGLLRSSGNPNLDQAGATMLQQSGPLPPVPANVPNNSPEGPVIKLALPLYPPS
jgi:TonB family protein